MRQRLTFDDFMMLPAEEQGIILEGLSTETRNLFEAMMRLHGTLDQVTEKVNSDLVKAGAAANAAQAVADTVEDLETALWLATKP